MKKLARPAIIIGIGLILAFSSAVVTYSVPPALQADLSATAFFLQPTTTPQVEDVSEIGSTDEIIVLGGIIVLIVIVPIFLYRKSWMHSQ